MIRLFYFSRPTSALLLAVLIFSLSIFAQTEDEVLTVDSSTVLLNATILDNNGKSATGLKREQFSVFENGVQQQISYFSAAETPFAAVILIDTSGSMESRISIARAAAINFLTGLRANDSAAIYRFSSKVELIQDFSGSQDINESVFELRADGMTALNDSIFKSAEELKKRRAIIVLSDGEDTSSGKSADKALKTALDAGALIYTIDMSSMDSNTRQRVQNQGILRNFAEKSGGKFVATPGGAALRQAFKGIVDELGIQYTLGYEPTNLQKDGKWRAIELRVARPNLTIRTRKGYNASK